MLFFIYLEPKNMLNLIDLKMKKLKLFLLSAFLCAGTLTTISCGDDEDEPEPMNNNGTESQSNQDKPSPDNPDNSGNPETPDNSDSQKKATFTVNFDSDGGSVVDSKTVEQDSKVAKPDDPTKDGFSFVAWYNGDSPYNFDELVTEDLNLKAVWESVSVSVSALSLNKETLELIEGQQETLTATIEPDNATDKSVLWMSSESSVAAVDANGVVTAIAAGNATITAFSDGKEAKCIVTVKKPSFTVTFDTDGGSVVSSQTVEWDTKVAKPANPTKDGYIFVSWLSDGLPYDFDYPVYADITITAAWESTAEYVDLGLPSGTLWATCNVGAERPWGFGDYFAWGEVSVKDEYQFENYEHRYETLSCPLAASLDAASVNKGDDWRMPTYSELDELKSLCTWEWTTNYKGTEVAGHIVYYTSKDNYIFVPAAGYMAGGSRCDSNFNGHYWSSMESYEAYAWTLISNASDDDINIVDDSERIGKTIRAVRRK